VSTNGALEVVGEAAETDEAAVADGTTEEAMAAAEAVAESATRDGGPDPAVNEAPPPCPHPAARTASAVAIVTTQTRRLTDPTPSSAAIADRASGPPRRRSAASHGRIAFPDEYAFERRVLHGMPMTGHFDVSSGRPGATVNGE
jgi:hypothetical protein